MAQGNYEILDHRADLKIRFWGKTKKELFANGLKAMTASQKPKRLRNKAVKRKMTVQSFDSTTLLVDFLAEALLLGQTHREVYDDCQFSLLADSQLEGQLLGFKSEAFDEDIKAVTYHNLDIRQKSDGGWEATVLFDI